MFKAMLEGSSALPAATGYVTDEGLEAGERVSENRGERPMSAPDNVAVDVCLCQVQEDTTACEEAPASRQSSRPGLAPVLGCPTPTLCASSYCGYIRKAAGRPLGSGPTTPAVSPSPPTLAWPTHNFYFAALHSSANVNSINHTRIQDENPCGQHRKQQSMKD